MADSPRLSEAELKKMFKEIADRPWSNGTIHHPHCLAVASGDVMKCNCGGAFFRG